jgi:hypothetical protein
MKQEGFMGNYQLLLAHDVVANEDKYRSLLEGFRGVVILDNSLIELGSPVSTEVMLHAANITNATYAVLPDKLFACAETVTASTTAAREWQAAGMEASFMIVAQGMTIAERIKCVEEISNQAELLHFAVGIPRAIVGLEGTRLATIEALHGQFKTWQHLLGFSGNYYDDVRCTKHSSVMGIDSATPIRLGYEKQIILNHLDEADPAAYLKIAREEFFEECKEFNSHMAYNLGSVEAVICK